MNDNYPPGYNRWGLDDEEDVIEDEPFDADDDSGDEDDLPIEEDEEELE